MLQEEGNKKTTTAGVGYIDLGLDALAAGKKVSAECRAGVAVCFVCLALRAKTRPSFPG
jgi:hypothetical protein